MKLRKKPIASAVALALMGMVPGVQAQEANHPGSDAQNASQSPAPQNAQAADKKTEKSDAAKKPSSSDAKSAHGGGTASATNVNAERDAASSPIVVAQATPAPPPPAAAPGTPVPLDSVNVTGIRQSLERSLEVKRN